MEVEDKRRSEEIKLELMDSSFKEEVCWCTNMAKREGDTAPFHAIANAKYNLKQIFSKVRWKGN